MHYMIFFSSQKIRDAHKEAKSPSVQQALDQTKIEKLSASRRKLLETVSEDGAKASMGSKLREWAAFIRREMMVAFSCCGFIFCCDVCANEEDYVLLL